MAAAAVDTRLQMVTVVLETAAGVAVDNEAEHARQLQETVPLLLLPVMQLACPLLQAVTIFREKMAHIDDSRKLWNRIQQVRKCIFNQYYKY